MAVVLGHNQLMHTFAFLCTTCDISQKILTTSANLLEKFTLSIMQPKKKTSQGLAVRKEMHNLVSGIKDTRFVAHYVSGQVDCKSKLLCAPFYV
jgi:hypothetical protein